MVRFEKGLFSWSRELQARTGLADDRMQLLERLVLHGIPRDGSSLPAWFSPHVLGDFGFRLCLETSWYIMGEALWIVESATDLGLTPEHFDPWLETLWAERVFLLGSAYFDTGEDEKARECWARLSMAQCPPVQRAAIQAKVRIEEAAELMSRGFFRMCLQKATTYAAEGSADCLCLLRLWSILTISHTALGNFAEAWKLLAEESDFLSVYSCPSQALFNMRRRIMLCVEQERFAEASELLKSAVLWAEGNSIAWALLLELKVELHLIRNETAFARFEMEKLAELVKRTRLSPSLLNTPEPLSELLLREKRGLEALQVCEPALQAALRRGDVCAECRTGLFLGRALALQKRYGEALKVVQRSLDLAEEHGYLPFLVEILFHAAGICFQAGEGAMSRIYLARAGKLALSLNLTIRLGCFRYVQAMSSTRERSARPLLKLLESTGLGPEVEYYLEYYGVLDESFVSVHDGERSSDVPAAHLRSLILRSAACYWFVQEHVLVVNSGESASTLPRIVSISNESLLARIFKALCSCPTGVSLPDIHAMKSSVAFHSLKHGVSCRMLVSRLRALLEKTGIAIVYDRLSEKYILQSNLPLFLLDTRSTGPIAVPRAPRGDCSQKAVAILASVQKCGKKTTHELCREFGVSRQALHPILRDLVKNARLKLVKKGPTSYYIANTKIS